jgi:hypothetical protein
MKKKSARTAAKPKLAAKAAAAGKAAPRKGGKGMVMVIFLLLAVGVAAQGYLLWKKDQRTKMVLSFVNEVARNGRDQDGLVCCARAMTVDLAGNFYMLEEPEVGHKLQKFTAAGKVLAAYRPKAGNDEQAIVQGYGLAADSKENLYVLESLNGRIKVLSPDLKFVRNIPNGSHNANALICNSKDELIFADREKSVLMVLNTKGEVLRKIDGGKNRLGGPFKLALGPDDSIWVLDAPRGFGESPDIKGFTREGEPIVKWTVKDFPANPYNYIGYHPKGYVVVNDNRGNSMGTGFRFYTPKGKLFGTSEITSNRWVFKNISGFVLDPARGDIFVNTNFIGRGADRFQWDPQAALAN